MSLRPVVRRRDGVNLLLDYKQAQRFSLAVHELATNAVKYGALSALTGDVCISWTAKKDGNDTILTFRWKEQKGPIVLTPTHQGFGSSLLRTMFTGSRLDYAADGFACELETVLMDSELVLEARAV